MSYECIYCDFTAPTNTRWKRHLATQKHATNFEKHQLEVENTEIVPQIIEELVQNTETKLCENIDCSRYPPDWDFEENTEENYEGGQWVKCTLCDGYFNDDGLGDILFIEEEPNNSKGQCNLCGKDNDIVQMKGTGQYICGNACDENDEEENVQEEPSTKCDEKCDYNEEEDVIREPSNINVVNNDENNIKWSVEDTNKLDIQTQTDDEIIDSTDYINGFEEDSVQEEEDESPYNMPSFMDNYQWLILDNETKKMMKNINETLISHPFIMKVVNIFMNIVWYFS